MCEASVCECSSKLNLSSVGPRPWSTASSSSGQQPLPIQTDCVALPIPATQAAGAAVHVQVGPRRAVHEVPGVPPARPAVPIPAKQKTSLFDRSGRHLSSSSHAAMPVPSDMEDEAEGAWGFGSRLFGSRATPGQHSVQPRHLQRHPSTASSAGRDELVHSCSSAGGMQENSRIAKGAGRGQPTGRAGGETGPTGSELGDFDGQQASEDEEDLRQCQISMGQVERLLQDDTAAGNPAVWSLCYWGVLV